MNRKAFTLTEVIGIVIILVSIILIITPNINNSLKNSKNKAFDVQIEEIKSATKSWVALNSENAPKNDNDEIVINLVQLKLSGLIAYDFKNPRTGDLFPDDMQIKIIKKGLAYTYTVLTDTGTNISGNIDPTGPQIILNGSVYLHLEVGESNSIPGATYKDKLGNNVNVSDIVYKKNDLVVNNIDFNNLGKYTVTYRATVDGKTNTIDRIVEIVDTTAPIISIENYENNVCKNMEMDSSFVLPSMSVTDNYTNSISIIKETIGNISSVPGIKKVTYKATDSSGNSSEFILCVNMRDTTHPVITNVENVYNSSLKTSVVTVTANDFGAGLNQLAYSFDNGKTWQDNNYYLSNETLIVRVRDKVGLISDGVTVIINNDSTPPTLTLTSTAISKTKANVTINAYDEDSGLSSSNQYKYYLSTSDVIQTGGSWINYESGTPFEISGTLGNYYLWVYPIVDKFNNANDNHTNINAPYVIKKFTLFDFTKEFAYKGSEESVQIPFSGYYKLEVWGAQGGNATGGSNGGTVTGVNGGYGGYSVGIYKATKGETLYVNVGGQGTSNGVASAGQSAKYFNGGYNGGGNALSSDTYGYVGSGGGATHISKKSGTLSTLSSSISNILIVAGGGGGASYYNYNSAGYKGQGGGGGGISGVSGYRTTVGTASTTPGTQASGNAFGQGTSSTFSSGYVIYPGGGGGFYGGKNGSNTGAAGGSGYIGNSLLISTNNLTKTMYCYNCTSSTGYSTRTVSTTNVSSTATSNYAKSGAGYAKITFVTYEAVEKTFALNDTEIYLPIGAEQKFIAPLAGYYKLEVWGAQGGSSSTTYIGGYGGYSVGVYKAIKGETLYVNVGGQGTASNGGASNGGYNGGGNALSRSSYLMGSGGGATHIAIISGKLSSFTNTASSLANILIVAGGGGGAGSGSSNGSVGGGGGGLTGVVPSNSCSDCGTRTGGSQTSGGQGRFGTGSFGQGAGSTSSYSCGGGGGLYGGAGDTYEWGASGGSGYIGNSKLISYNGITKTMYCYNCTGSSVASTKTISTTNVSSTATSNYAKSGAGYAKITYLGNN